MIKVELQKLIRKWKIWLWEASKKEGNLELIYQNAEIRKLTNAQKEEMEKDFTIWEVVKP